MVDIPVVLHPITSSEFLQYLVEQHAGPTLLIICTSRDCFLQQLLHCIETTPQGDHQADVLSNTATAPQPAPTPPDEPPPAQQPPRTARPHPLLTPTLSLLSRSRSTTLAFCPSLKSLHAYLSTLRSPSFSPSSSSSSPPSPLGSQSQPPPPPTSRETKKPQNRASAPILALLNPIELHRGTAEFSAQGLSRTFAAAVEAARWAGRRLVVAECAGADAKATTEMGGEDEDGGGGDGDGGEEDEGRDGVEHAADPWEEEVSILNVATKRFGAGERGWVGRTVRVRRVVERWCVFEGAEGRGGWVG